MSRRLARLASCLAAAGDRSRMGPIRSNGTAKMSCSTNASRSEGDSVSRTTSRARPTESASSACCSGSSPCGGDHRVRHVRVERFLVPGHPGPQHVQADAGHHGGQPRAQVLHLGARPVQPQPGLLDGVVGLAQRAEHPVGHGAQVRAVRLELSGRPVCRVHCYLPSARFVIPIDDPNGAEVTNDKEQQMTNEPVTGNPAVRPSPRAQTMALQSVGNRIVRGLLRTPLLSRLRAADLSRSTSWAARPGVTTRSRWPTPAARATCSSARPSAGAGTCAPGSRSRSGSRAGGGWPMSRSSTDERAVTDAYGVMCRDNRTFAKFNRVGLDAGRQPGPDRPAPGLGGRGARVPADAALIRPPERACGAGGERRANPGAPGAAHGGYAATRAVSCRKAAKPGSGYKLRL